MASLSILIVMVAVSLLIRGWALAAAARKVGSSRGRFRIGVGVAFLLLLMSISFTLLDGVIEPESNSTAILIALVLLGALFALALIVLAFSFRLTLKRTLAPFAAFIALVLAELGVALLVIKPLIIEAFVLPTRSMSPTLDEGDQFIGNKLLRPRRLDLVAYWSTDADPAIFCKRLIGLPGERLRFEEGGILVNDQAVALPPVLAGRCHASPAALPPARARYRDGETIALGEDEYFLIGDNVDASRDSRTMGPSHASSLIAVVDLVYGPLGRVRVLR